MFLTKIITTITGWRWRKMIVRKVLEKTKQLLMNCDNSQNQNILIKILTISLSLIIYRKHTPYSQQFRMMDYKFDDSIYQFNENIDLPSYKLIYEVVMSKIENYKKFLVGEDLMNSNRRLLQEFMVNFLSGLAIGEKGKHFMYNEVIQQLISQIFTFIVYIYIYI